MHNRLRESMMDSILSLNVYQLVYVQRMPCIPKHIAVEINDMFHKQSVHGYRQHKTDGSTRDSRHDTNTAT